MRFRIAALVAALSGAAAAQPSQLWHTHLAGFGAKPASGRFYAQVKESDLGVDVNGDGDQNDYVPRVMDPATRSIAVLPFATHFAGTSNVAAAGDFEAIPVLEWDQGNTVLNGDGDTNDDVLLIRRASTGQGFYLPLAVTPSVLLMSADGSLVVTQTSEVQQGVDINGNGTKDDVVVVMVDPATGIWKTAGQAPNFGTEYLHPLAGGQAVVELSEAKLATDLDGDGDQTDVVPALFDFATGGSSPLGVAITGHVSVLSGEQKFLIHVSEPGSGGIDLDGDGDALDIVPAIVDRATLTLQSLGLSGNAAGEPGPGIVAHVLVTAPESANSADFNGDGDQLDVVPFVFDLATGAAVNLGIALTQNGGAVIGEGYVAFTMLENKLAPPMDGNGDGDLWDIVPFVYDIASGELSVLPLALTFFQVDLVARGPVLLLRAEEYSNQTDFDFDGDLADSCAWIYDAPTRTLMNLGRSMTDLAYVYPGAAALSFHVAEHDEGNASLNGDADANDEIAAIYDPAARSLFEAPFADWGPPYDVEQDTLLVIAENQQGMDLTGNGLLTESELSIYRPQVNGCGAFASHGEGCPTSAGRTPELEIHGCAVPSGQVRIQIRGAIPGESALLVLGHQPATLPLGGGCSLLVAPVLPFIVGPIPLAANGLFGGAALLPATLPANAQPGTIALQAFVSDPALFKGYAASNAVVMSLAP